MVVLVIEDEPGIADFLRRGLESAGFGVEIAADGQLGLRIAQQRDEVELVILDLGLPGLPGEYVLRRLRAVQAGPAGDRPYRQGRRSPTRSPTSMPAPTTTW